MTTKWPYGKRTETYLLALFLATWMDLDSFSWALFSYQWKREEQYSELDPCSHLVKYLIMLFSMKTEVKMTFGTSLWHLSMFKKVSFLRNLQGKKSSGTNSALRKLPSVWESCSLTGHPVTSCGKVTCSATRQLKYKQESPCSRYPSLSWTIQPNYSSIWKPSSQFWLHLAASPQLFLWY